jgi:hypothetical protein
MLVHTHTVHVLPHDAAQIPVAQAALPIVPILLLPFILVFFVIVFPVWLLALGVLALALAALRAGAALFHRGRPGAFDAPIASVQRALQWVMTFGGYFARGTPS